MADLLSRFRSISRPSLSRSSSTSVYSSYAKKQQAAEDAIIDNQYEAGTLSPEAYLSALQSRLSRTTNTPLTNVNLQEKISKVQEKVTDAQVSNQYASGSMSTKEVLAYEQQKLARMTEPNNPAYQAQQQKVIQLQNKAEREERASYRTAEMLRISQMPDDSSARAWEKASLYKQLADQARLDGDVQQADQLETQANNYTTIAKKGDINDLITQARLSVSETTGAGLGTPSAEGGISRLFGSGPTSGGVTGGGGPQNASSGSTASPSVATGFTGVKNSTTNRILEGIDRKYMSYERTAQQLNDTNSMIAAYQGAIASADGDQKTQLTIALNNLIESRNTKMNQLQLIEEGINDDVVRLQEAQAKAAASSFTQEVRKNDKEFARVEDQLEKAFAKGEITKEEYIQKGLALAATKSQFYSQSSDVFNQYGNDSSAQTFLDKAAQMEEVHQNLIGVAQNLDSYEPIATDPGGKITNLFGKGLQAGDVALVNVQKLKDSGDFDVNYVKDGGVYKRVYYPGQESMVGDGYISKAVAEELSKNATDPNMAPFVYASADPKIGPKTGRVTKEPLVKTSTGEWVTNNTYNTIKETATQSLEKVLGKTNQTTKLINEIKKSEPGTPAMGMIDRLFKPLSEVPVVNKKEQKNLVSSAIGNAISGVQDWFGNAVSSVKGLFNQAKDKFAGAQKNIGLPPLVGKVSAKEGGSNVEQIIRQQAAAYGVDPELMIEIARAESRLDPNAAARRSGYDGVTIDKKTGRPYPYSSAEGLFQFTDATWKDAIKAGVIPNNAKKTDPQANAKSAAYFISKGQISRWDASKSKWQPAVDSMAKAPKTPEVASTNVVQPRSLDQEIAGPTMIMSQGPGFTNQVKLPIQPKAPASNIPSYIPPVQRLPINTGSTQPSQPTVQAGKGFVQDVFKPAVKQVQTWAAPKIESFKQAATPVVQNVQKNVSSAVSNAVSNVKNWLSNINPFKKR